MLSDARRAFNFERVWECEVWLYGVGLCVIRGVALAFEERSRVFLFCIFFFFSLSLSLSTSLPLPISICLKVLSGDGWKSRGRFLGDGCSFVLGRFSVTSLDHFGQIV